MSAPISRTQAWCKLAALIADGMPAPKGISFHPTISTITVSCQDEAAMHAWAERFQMVLDLPLYHDGFVTYGGYGPRDAWHGFTVSVSHYHLGEPPAAPKPVTEDMTRVREVAERLLPDDEESCRAFDGEHEPHDGHVYSCCGKVGRISAHEAWCEANVVGPVVSGE